ncbi:hypothetical protein BHQ18_02750 [Mycolicibacterium flavescens]|uniref:Amidase domain-containing protein n=2 Tax=Mycolicibacterium flavescens TaxID=1776 RepID=A0A1E3RQB5_MYCFV|nr:hypothetical protein BHQ18_02750 [Mycolicibacterium flavescens]
MAADLADGRVSARELLQRSLIAASRPAARAALITTTTERAAHDADASDTRRQNGSPTGVLDGVPLVIKDVFDVAGTVTTGGSRRFSRRPPAAADSEIVRRARAAGLVVVGKANTSELAFSGLGINETFGTPANPNDAALVPGGSSSGSAVAVATGVAPLAIGTDTSGSVRVPAAFCGCVGFRASRRRYGRPDHLPLSPALDRVGILARTVDDVVMLDGLLAPGRRRPGREFRAVVPRGEWVVEATAGVRELFDAAVDALSAAGVRIDCVTVPSLRDAQRLTDIHGTIVGADAYRRYRRLASSPDIEDATRRRLLANRDVDRSVARVRAQMPALRRRLRRDLDGALLLCPTVRHEPHRVDELRASPSRYDAANASTLRTTMVLSVLGTCGISVPLRRGDGSSTVGLLLSLPEGEDEQLLAAARQVERVVTPAFHESVAGRTQSPA